MKGSPYNSYIDQLCEERKTKLAEGLPFELKRADETCVDQEGNGFPGGSNCSINNTHMTATERLYQWFKKQN
jgi:hypothetical protein